MMDIKDMLKKDVEERAVISAGMKRMRNRQVIIIFVLIAIFCMFLLNYLKLQKQIAKEDAVIITLTDVITQGAVIMNENTDLINKQDSIINSIQK